MDLEPLMQKLQENLGIEHLTPNDSGEYAIEFDSWLEVRVSLLDRATVMLLSMVGRQPADDFAAERFLEEVLRCGLAHFQQLRDVVSIEPESGDVQLRRTINLDSLTALDLQEELEEFVNHVEYWTKHLDEDSSRLPALPPQIMLMP